MNCTILNILLQHYKEAGFKVERYYRHIDILLSGGQFIAQIALADGLGEGKVWITEYSRVTTAYDIADPQSFVEIEQRVKNSVREYYQDEDYKFSPVEWL